MAGGRRGGGVKGILTALTLAITLLVSLALYRLAHEVRTLEGELADMDRVLVDERQAIGVLEAEWSYLARPAAVQARALRHLDLVPLTARQVVQVADLPTRQERLRVEPTTAFRARPRQAAALAESAERGP
jgi:hypothetical protein